MLVQYERVWFRSAAERSDRLDDFSRFREVVGGPDAPDAAILPVNDFSTWWNSASCRLPDCQGTEANEKLVGLVAFVPGGIEDWYKGAAELRPVDPKTSPGRRGLIASVERGLTVHKKSGRLVGGLVGKPHKIDRHDAGQSSSETSLGPRFVRNRDAATRLGDERIWRLLAVRGEVGLRRAS